MTKKLKLLVAAAATLALAVFVLAGCAGGSDSASSSSEEPKAAPESEFTLIVGLDNAYPPYGFVGDNGELTGFDVDLAKEACERLGWNLQLEAIDWDTKDAQLDSGAINCIWNGFTLEGREDGYTFSEPYMLNEQVVVVREGADVNTLEDLAGKTVVTQADSAALDVLETDAAEGGKADLAATFADLATIGDYNNAFLQLDSGAVDAVACDLSIAQYQMAGNPGKYVMLAEPLSSEHYAVGFKKGDTEHAEAITQTLKEMYEDGTVEAICANYADYGLSFENWILK